MVIGGLPEELVGVVVEVLTVSRVLDFIADDRYQGTVVEVGADIFLDAGIVCEAVEWYLDRYGCINPSRVSFHPFIMIPIIQRKFAIDFVPVSFTDVARVEAFGADDVCKFLERSLRFLGTAIPIPFTQQKRVLIGVWEE